MRRFIKLVRMSVRLGLIAAWLSACASGPSLGESISGMGRGPEYQPRTRASAADAPRYEDCNDNAIDGRETNVKNSDRHCGRCGHVCEGRCVRGVCKDTALPPQILFDWPGEDPYPRQEDRALALTKDDELNHALACPESRVADAAVAGGHRCRYPRTAALRIGGHVYWAAGSQAASEHDGMYSVSQAVVLFAPQPGGLHVVATLSQWNESVADCHSNVTMRRAHVVDLDGDGATELCLETVEEQGVGLFYVMAMQDDNERWAPLVRSRRTDAYRAEARRLVHAPGLSPKCPARDYAMFVDLAPYDDPLAWRRSLQGDPALAACPSGPVKACFRFTALCPTHS